MATLQSFHFTVKPQIKEAKGNLKKVQRGTAGEFFAECSGACADCFCFVNNSYSFESLRGHGVNLVTFMQRILVQFTN